MKKPKREEKPNLEFLLPPYFYFENCEDPWYHISLHLAKTAQHFRENYRIFPVLCMSKSLLLDTNYFNKILKDYKQFNGFILWISDFNEQREDEDYLRGVLRLSKRFKEENKQVYNLYGGYFSLLLSKKYFEGFVRSIGYGESKPVEPSPGGGPLPQRRFYSSLIHTNLSESRARILFEKIPNLMCQCDICSFKETKNVDEFFSQLSNDDFKKHFIVSYYFETQMSFKDYKPIEQILSIVQR